MDETVELHGYKWEIRIEHRLGSDYLVIPPMCEIRLDEGNEENRDWRQDRFLLWLLVSVADAAYDYGHDCGYDAGVDDSWSE